MNEKRSAPLDELLKNLVDGQLDEVGEQRLQTALEDPQSRRQYLDQLAMHALLYWHWGRVLTDDVAADARPAAPRPVVTAWSGAARFLPRATGYSLITAAVVVIAGLTLLANFLVRPHAASNPPLSMPPSRPLAAVENRHDCAGQVAGVPVAHATKLPLGGTVALASGLVEFRFPRGVQVLLEGPAQLHFVSEKIVNLRYGKLTAKVAAQGRGFTVETPGADIVDLGTEFGVDAAPQGHTVILVYKGEVQVRRRSPSGSPTADSSQSFRLTTGQMLNLPASSAQTARLQKFVGDGNFARELPGDLPRLERRTAIFQQGAPDPITGEEYCGCEDTQLLTWAPEANFGGRADFDVGAYRTRQPARSLIRFDLRSLQGKAARVTRVTLRLTVSQAAYSPAGMGEVRMHRVSDRNADWGEGHFHSAGPGNPVSGHASWNLRRHPNVAWAGASGANVRGGDYEAPVLANYWYSPALRGRVLDLDWKQNLAPVQGWIDGRPNAGLLLKEAAEYAVNRINFHSSEAQDPQVRPALIVEYIPSDAVAPPVSIVP